MWRQPLHVHCVHPYGCSNLDTDVYTNGADEKRFRSGTNGSCELPDPWALLIFSEAGEVLSLVESSQLRAA